MPAMTRSDFPRPVPANADAILQFINDLILCHEESFFWDDDPAAAERWESDLIARYLSGDRSGNLSGAPDPLYPNNDKKEDSPMTTRDFLMNLIAHCETIPQPINLATATDRLRLLDPTQIPSDLTPESFMATWNDIVTNDLPAGNWITPDHSGT